MDENKSGLYLVAIVAILAVVALAALVFNRGGTANVPATTMVLPTASVDPVGQVYARGGGEDLWCRCLYKPVPPNVGPDEYADGNCNTITTRVYVGVGQYYLAETSCTPNALA